MSNKIIIRKAGASTKRLLFFLIPMLIWPLFFIYINHINNEESKFFGPIVLFTPLILIGCLQWRNKKKYNYIEINKDTLSIRNGLTGIDHFPLSDIRDLKIKTDSFPKYILFTVHNQKHWEYIGGLEPFEIAALKEYLTESNEASTNEPIHISTILYSAILLVSLLFIAILLFLF